LENDDTPSILRILKEGKRKDREFLQYLDEGGRIEDVLRTCFDLAKEADENASHREVFEDAINELPVCQNDGQFDRVAKLCGLTVEAEPLTIREDSDSTSCACPGN